MEERKDMISVIIPVYNGQDYLENCIKSLEEQTFKAFEIVIVNDGSTDGTGALCEKLCAEHENIRVLTLDDQGVSAARNEGLKEARGEFITFVDADDRVRSDMLEVLYNLITSTGSDLAGCDFLHGRMRQSGKRKQQGKICGRSFRRDYRSSLGGFSYKGNSVKRYQMLGKAL